MSRSTTTEKKGFKGDRQVRRIVAAVSLSAFVEWAGACAVLPLLPLYLRHHGSSVTLVGFTMAAFFAAAVLVQYPMGRLSDRIGRKKVQIGGLVIYAVGSILFGVVVSPIAALLFRALQGVGGGVVDVANAATIGETVPERWRGRAFGALFGSRTIGMAVGPFFGSLAGISGMRWLFFAAAGCALAAAIPVKLFVPVGSRDAALVRSERAPLWRNRSVVGVVVGFLAGGLLVGLYETCWSLLLALRGAATWQVGLSWTLFAFPFAVMSVPAGWLVDRFDRRYLTYLAMTGSAVFAALYPYLHSVALLVALGAVEAVTVAIGQPAQSSQLVHSVPASQLGRAQGAASTAQTAATAIAATLSGTLFGVNPAIPFVLVAGSMVAAIAVMAVLWRNVSGRNRLTEDEEARRVRAEGLALEGASAVPRLERVS
jgi:DHA1 family multidrug resistance protein-like MFS transporter